MNARRPVACIALPDLPVVSHHGVPASTCRRPRTVHRGRGSAARVAWRDRAAAAAGVRIGASLSAARAHTADLETIELEPARLHRAQRAVLHDLLTLSPRVAAEGASRFWAEPPSTSSLLDDWCAAVRAKLRDRGPVAVGIGPSAVVAHAASLDAVDTARIIADHEARAFLDGSPLEVLEVGEEATDVLAALGVRTVAQLRALSPASLAIRFGPVVAEARRRADGVDHRGPTTARPPEPFEASVAVDDALDGVEPLLFLLRPLTAQVAKGLRARGVGALGLELALSLGPSPSPRIGGARPSDTVHRLEARTSSPLVQDRPMLELLRARLERIRLSGPVSGLRLRALSVTDATRELSSGSFFEAAARDPAAREVALDRLRTRLGAERIARASRIERGPSLARAEWLTHARPTAGTVLPWRTPPRPIPLRDGFATIGGLARRVRHLGRIERVTPPWWDDGTKRIVLLAWAELDGPLLALLRARCQPPSASSDDDGGDDWEVVAWVD